MSYRALGQAPQPEPAASSADVILWGGILGGIAVMMIGNRMGQHRLWSRSSMFRNGRRRRRARR